MRVRSLAWGVLALLPTAVRSQYNDTLELLWGTYRPNLYFGLRPRLPQSLMTGLMWFGTQDYQSFRQTRHSCEQGDNLDSYTWTEHDPREGGVQIIKDNSNNLQLTTEFLKVPGGDHGGSWAVRIRGEPMTDARPSRSSLLFYFGMEGFGGLEMITDEDDDGIQGPVKLSGTSPDLGDFTMRIIDGRNNVYVTEGTHSGKFRDRTEKTHFIGLNVPKGNIWQAREALMQNILKRAQEVVSPYKDDPAGPPDPAFALQFSNEVYTSANLYAFQKTFDGEFSFDVFFDSASVKQKLDSHILDNGIPSFRENFRRRFDAAIPVPQGSSSSILDFSRAITSNLLGGIGYFYGTSIIDRTFSREWDRDESDIEDGEPVKAEHKPELTEPVALLTATPSRSFFPRGFYWDEGFHLMHIGAWDNDLSLEILRDWINLIDDDGWVGREQILGEEARSKVPQEFQTQVPSYANPPTLTMAVTAFIARAKAASHEPSMDDLGMREPMQQVPLSDPISDTPSNAQLLSVERATEFLRGIYPKLKRHYDWFRRTQRGLIKQYGRKARSRIEAYRWRGRTESHILTSGMDDYPRGPPHVGELHLDLISWMGFFTRTMREIAEFVGETDDQAVFEQIEAAIVGNIDDLHWSDEQEMYCDVDVDENDESYHVCEGGYVSIFPLLLGLLPPTSPHLGPILDLMESPDHLWSPYGLRSLSLSHPLHGQGENYWRGPIWVQMNYLALGALHKRYMVEEGPHRERAAKIYKKLRQNIIQNVHKEWERTGYVWEQYDAATGHGQRTKPFTGWTSLVSLILAEKY